MNQHELFKRKLAEKLGFRPKNNNQGQFEKSAKPEPVKGETKKDDSLSEAEYDDLMYWIRQNY